LKFGPGDNGADGMRWVYLTIVVLFVAVILVFALQNLGIVRMSFLGFSIRAPLSILAVIIYVLGAFTGGSLFALLRRSMKKSRAGGA
jgi:lipopolysaccharide assembly protein A